jgi:hypothetical protein
VNSITSKSTRIKFLEAIELKVRVADAITSLPSGNVDF